MRVVFMGTPEFAVSALHEIHLNSRHEVTAVVTVPDKPAGRGQKLHSSAVKQYAVEHNIPVFQPDKLRDEDFINSLKELKPDVFVVVAFRMLPKSVWEIPAKGTFNLHASLLPQYRGAAPINRAVMNGEKESGVTTFLIDEKIDTGNILLQAKVEINENDNAGDLHDKLMEAGKKLVLDTLDKLESGNIEPKPQEDSNELKPAPKIFKEDCKIDWTASSEKIHNHIRGLSPFPGAWCQIKLGDQCKTLKIFSGKLSDKNFNSFIGQVTWENGELYVQLADGSYIIETLQLEGKKKISAKEFMNGIRDKESLVIEAASENS